VEVIFDADAGVCLDLQPFVATSASTPEGQASDRARSERER
jgi:hypothetical protein